mmetsp:Transcript_91505/g.144577  ORF Transcript_91505/g.144577 Transcript_91505/m.144577 type:complete len:542 (-) Transcript_91505:153-1778(-)|eukprot:CAMPEP_0169071994 /NCGR_PEP_ID=MMETSP1015-20121227/5950_1 /TAXON_ID=342587 /ORGANISM="Karlodinium micrum, Strain CCMP2283" /LENGTH=541 /DNA_ID=CAMNT_0009131105 /DNA_START=76 /DNA_END=1701 /DNA_ORIENTATION=+
MSMSLCRARADAESRLSEEKRAVEKRKNIIVLCARFFADLGYHETVRQIQAETNISLDKLDAADNVDLTTVLTEYEDFYEMRFGRKPKLTRKAEGRAADFDKKLPRLPPDGTRGNTSQEELDAGGTSKRRARSETRKPREDSRPPREKPPQMPNASLENVPAPTQAEAPAFEGGLVGHKVSKAPPGGKCENKHEDTPVDGDDPFENRLFKALPHFGVDKEYRDLAIAISRDILTRNPGVPWHSIVGLDHAKALLKEAVVMPLKYPELFTGLLTPWKGVLLFGPPGTGKTLLAKAVATECDTTFFNISASTVVSKWRGDSEKLIRVLFDLARHHQPSTIFIDELDSLMGARGGGDGEHEGSRRMKTELLIQLDGLLRDVKDQVFLLAASNLPWDLDSAMLRRLEKRVLVNLPTVDAREQMIRTSLPEGFAEGLEYGKLAELTNDWSGSDIRLLCKEAAMHPLRRLMTEIESSEQQAQPEKSTRTNSRQRAAEKSAVNSTPPAELKMGPVTHADCMQALQTVHPAPASHVEKYTEWQQQFGAA